MFALRILRLAAATLLFIPLAAAGLIELLAKWHVGVMLDIIEWLTPPPK